MAIDSAEKRFSMLNFGEGTTINLLFEPDGSVDKDDKAHLLDLYSSGEAAPPPGGSLEGMTTVTAFRDLTVVLG